MFYLIIGYHISKDMSPITSVSEMLGFNKLLKYVATKWLNGI